MQKVKVLHLIAPTTIAGAERVLLNLTDYIDGKNFESIVGTFISIKKKTNPFLYELKKRGLKSNVIYMKKTIDFRNIIEVLRIIRKEGIDILHTHGYRSDVIGIICSKIARIPIISTVHGWTPTSPKVKYYEFVDRLSLIFFNKIIAVSKDVELSLISAFGTTKKIERIPNAIGEFKIKNYNTFDFRRKFSIEKEKIIIGCISRLSKEKGIQYLIKAFAEVLKEKKNVVLLIVGDGIEKKKLIDLTIKMNLSKKVIFYGFERDIARIYATIDLFVLPSLTEGTPMALLEAMKFNVPVVATSVGEVPNIIKNEINGLLVEPGNSQLLSKNIKYALTNLLNNKQIIKEAKKTVEEHYDVRKWVKKIQALYINIVETEMDNY